MKTKDLVVQAFIAGIYVALTMAFEPISYGAIQVRVSELLMLLMLVGKKPIWGITIGCFIANLFSPLGLPDVVFGTLATFISCLLMIYTKNDWLKLMWPALVNGLIVGMELTILFEGIPFILNALYVFVGEIVAVFIPGLLLKNKIRNNRVLQESLQ